MLILELREQELCAQAVDELVVKLRHEIEQGTSISTIGVCLSKVVDSACAEFAHAMNLIHDECDYKPPVARERTSDGWSEGAGQQGKRFLVCAAPEQLQEGISTVVEQFESVEAAKNAVSGTPREILVDPNAGKCPQPTNC